jgi:leader peptidase (prepilin peptidase)/N-methyltransferase
VLIELLQQPAWAVGCAFLFGLMIGSFLNVVILRVPARLEWQWKRDSRDLLGIPEPEPSGPDADAGEPPPDIVVKRSFCPRCHHQLAAVDNIPVLSWLVLRGRCRYCKAPISVQYPAVELLTAAASAVVVWHFGPGWQALAALVFTWMLVALSGIDLRTTLLPDQITYPLLWIGLLLSTVTVFVDPVSSLLGATAGYLSLWSVFWAFKLVTGKDGMGRGDFKLLAALGAWCGIKGVFPIVLVSALLGAVIGSAWLLLRGRDRATPIPFGPYLAVAGWIQLLWGSQLIEAYLHFSGVR